MLTAWLKKLQWRLAASPPTHVMPTVLGSGVRPTITSGERWFEAADIVTSLYSSILRRAPDPDGLSDHTRSLRQGAGLPEVIQSFVGSKEFAGLAGSLVDRFPLDGGGPQRIDLPDTSDGHSALWRHVAEVWSAYGHNDPYWSVLTDERYRAKNMGDAEVLEAFYTSGAHNIERMQTWLARNELPSSQDMVCAEYGCGVGRCTLWLARKFRRVVAFDISQPHLDAARMALERHGVTNVDFVLVKGPDDLARLDGVDLFFSIIVLQHNPPPIIVDILKSAFSGLRPGGHAYFQVPTYGADYSFNEAQYRRLVQKQKTMEMHCLPQKVVFDLADRSGLKLVEVQPDNMTGAPHIFVSNTFLMTKPA